MELDSFKNALLGALSNERSNIRDFVWDTIKKKIAYKIDKNEIYFVSGNESHALIEKLEWDSNILGLSIGRLYLDYKGEDDILLKNIFKKAHDEKISLIITRIPLKYIELIRFLISKGFKLCDILVTFNKKLHNIQIEQNFEYIRLARRSDLDRLKEITHNTFVYSHYYKSPFIEISKANELYLRWVENDLKGRGIIFVYEDEKNESIVGYIALLIRVFDSTKQKIKLGYIDLIAIDKNMRGQGIGSQLVKYALNFFKKNNVAAVYVATQASNISAVRIYEKAGFRLLSSEVTLHLLVH